MPKKSKASVPSLNWFSFPQIDVATSVTSILHKAAAFSPAAASATNKIDPITAAAEWAVASKSLGRAMTEAEWWKAEAQRQLQKSIANSIGEAQQEIIGSLDGWTSYTSVLTKPDLVGQIGNQKIIAEVKNKKNTTNKGSGGAVYDEMANYLDGEYKGYVGILVQAMHPFSRKPYWTTFHPGKRPERKDLINMSGRVFYAIAADAAHRQPVVDFDELADLKSWPSWTAFDSMCKLFYDEIENQTSIAIEPWLRDLLKTHTKRPAGLI